MRFCRPLLALCFVLGLILETPAQRPSEYEVKAAFLYNFARFVTWPDTAFAGADSPLVIGVFGPDPFGPVLDRTVAGKTAQGRAFVVERYRRLRDVGPCHILFVHPSEHRRLDLVIAQLQRKSVLLVGESEAFCRDGGMVNFILVQRRVRFEMNSSLTRSEAR